MGLLGARGRSVRLARCSSSLPARRRVCSAAKALLGVKAPWEVKGPWAARVYKEPLGAKDLLEVKGSRAAKVSRELLGANGFVVL